MSARRQYQRQHPRRITVRGIRRAQPDLHKLSRVLISLAEAQAEKEAEQQAEDQAQHPGRTQSTEPEDGDD